ncbi:hypothetical protein B7R21_18170 [Subtercola boreus]|uniref:Uncharacterized protein n=1 Tax=Subtercola boreus TaxID=120213 RepID=A0A3E0VBD0_9MICO|nr:hypothetical protein [Subtercola boreus]RFA06833.1 hypothetical protein B7R21_18170 [Subtercola boreus]
MAIDQDVVPPKSTLEGSEQSGTGTKSRGPRVGDWVGSTATATSLMERERFFAGVRIEIRVGIGTVRRRLDEPMAVDNEYGGS